MIYWTLFLTFLKIGAFTFGGGYAMLPLIQEAVIIDNQWMTYEEFLDMLAVAEMTPGPIAINTATFVGERMGGVFGAVCTTLGVVLPSLIIITFIAKVMKDFSEKKYIKDMFSGLRPVVLGLILSSAISVGAKTVLDIKSAVLAMIFFLLLRTKKINPILLIVMAGACGLILY